MKTILPSLMSKNQTELNQDFKKLIGIKTLHLDVIDGKFANNKTFQFPFKLKRTFQYNVHLMINHPEAWIQKHGHKVHTIIFHPETTKDPLKIINQVKQLKKKVGLALKPETKVKDIRPYLPLLDCLLILTVRPGFYGGQFLPSQIKKIKQVRSLNKKVKIIIDGGLNPKTIKAAKAADFFVSGSYTTKAEHPKIAIKNLLRALN